MFSKADDERKVKLGSSLNPSCVNESVMSEDIDVETIEEKVTLAAMETITEGKTDKEDTKVCAEPKEIIDTTKNSTQLLSAYGCSEVKTETPVFIKSPSAVTVLSETKSSFGISANNHLLCSGL